MRTDKTIYEAISFEILRKLKKEELIHLAYAGINENAIHRIDENYHQGKGCEGCWFVLKKLGLVVEDPKIGGENK